MRALVFFGVFEYDEVSLMNVTELARRLKVPTNVLLETLPQYGFHIGRRAIKVDDRVARKIIERAEAGEIKFGGGFFAKREDMTTRGAAPTIQVTGPVKIASRIIVHQLAAALGLPVTRVIAELMKNGILATLNQEIDFETASIIADDLGFKVEPVSAEEEEARVQAFGTEQLKIMLGEETEENLAARPPVVVVMGHVDHGKTKLLDAIRKTNVMEGESGGITQHIGAYQVEKKGQPITFLDTPGHEAFRAMRTRGGKVADIAILVVAADDGIQPQTDEAIKIIQQEKLPFIVAINKIDKPDADPERVKRELADRNLLVEDWGGKVIAVPISAKQGKNIDQLLDMVLLVRDLENPRANPNREALGTIIEAHLDANEGPVATVLVQGGTLKIGDLTVVGNVVGKVKTLKDYRGQMIKEAPPGTPARILGLKGTPQVGDILQVTRDKKLIREKTKESPRAVGQRAAVNLEAFKPKQEGMKTLKMILKSDVLGSEEAILESLVKWQGAEVSPEIISRGLGNITDGDVLSADAARPFEGGTGAIIYGFKVNATKAAQDLAQEKHVQIKRYEVIYHLLEDVKKELEKLLAPEVLRFEIGRLKILAVFKQSGKKTIAGGRVAQGKVTAETKAAVKRGNEIIGVGEIAQVQTQKSVVAAAHEGQECGIEFSGPVTLAEGDVLEIYREEEKEKHLVS